MRIALILDDDVAALLARIQAKRKVSLKRAVNEALRRGLQQMTSQAPPRQPYRTPEVSLGRCLVGGIDDVAEILEAAEGESYR